jgi:predicted RecA/RadA family phage recombinase
MKNFIQPGDSLTVSAPYAVTSGQGVLVGALFGIAAYDAASSTTVEIQTETRGLMCECGSTSDTESRALNNVCASVMITLCFICS